MGFVGFLRFCLLCLDSLAWPTFALIYPLWASIRAIETSSKHHMKKLVTYWTIFSLITLFEIFFVKLIEWLPIWPYIKLVAICWLVIPQFNGACHVYQCFIHPCLSIDPLDIINRFSIPKEKSYSEDSFLASAETYLKENGPEALEKLIAIKGKHKEHIPPDADALEVVKSMEPTKKNVTTQEQLVEHPKLHLVVSEKKEVATPETQRVSTPAESKEKRPLEIHDLRKVQREWTCPVCQLTTTSEASLNSHLLGKKHRSKCEKLKTSTQTTKNMQSSATKDKSNSEELKTSRQTSKDLNSSATKANDSSQAKNILKIYLPGERSKQNTTEKPKNTYIGAASEQQMKEKPKKTNAKVNEQPLLWYEQKTNAKVNEQPILWYEQKMNAKVSEQPLLRYEQETNAKVNEQPIFWYEQKMNAKVNEQPILWYEQKTIAKVNEQPILWYEQPTNAKVNEQPILWYEQPIFWCGICNITCTGKIDMDSHLKGRKHLYNLQIISSGGSVQA